MQAAVLLFDLQHKSMLFALQVQDLTMDRLQEQRFPPAETGRPRTYRTYTGIRIVHLLTLCEFTLFILWFEKLVPVDTEIDNRWFQHFKRYAEEFQW